MDIVLNTAYNLFPDSKAAKKKDERQGRGQEGAARRPEEDDGEMSTEAVAMAYLLRGVHF